MVEVVIVVVVVVVVVLVVFVVMVEGVLINGVDAAVPLLVVTI